MSTDITLSCDHNYRKSSMYSALPNKMKNELMSIIKRDDVFEKLFENIEFQYSNHFDDSFWKETAVLFNKAPFLTLSVSVFHPDQMLSTNQVTNSQFNKEIKIYSICFEFYCFVISATNAQTEQSLIEFLSFYQKQLHCSIFYCSFDESTRFNPSTIKISNRDNKNEEIFRFYSHYKTLLDNYPLVLLFVPSVVCYKIQRFYMRRQLFFDDTFFDAFEKYKYTPGDKQKESESQKYIFDPNDFLMLRYLGNGSTSTIFLYLHTKTFYPFAIKEFRSDLDNIDQIIEREQKFYENYSHPFIVHYYGNIKFPNKPKKSFILEFMSNGTLAENIKSFFFNEGHRVHTLLRLLFSVNYLHSHHIIHRDLKPENILLNHNLESFLCDFGAIRSPDNQEELTQNIGSDYYSAPELGSSTISTSSDLFSIGMIQYFLFLKTHPDRSNKESAPLFTKEYGRLTNLYQYLTDLKPNSRYNTFISIIYLICDQKNFYLNMIHNQCFQSEIFDGKVKDFDKSKVRGYDPSAHSENYIQLIYSLPSINSSHLDRKKEIQKKYNVLSLNDYDQEYYSNNKDKYGYLGNLYYRARYILSNGEKMMHFLEKASSFNHAEAQSIMGLAYFYGHHIPQDIRRSVYYFELAANNGHTYSQHMMGVFYKDHQTVPQDLKKSIKYFTMAANSNRKQSHYSLGMIYLSNNSYHDINKALHHLHVAADKHFDAKAMYSLGVLYVEGDLISQNLEKGITYLQNSALQLFLEAHFYLGKMYSEGKYISSDIDKAIHFLELPAQQNHVPSIHLLGHIYSEKLGNIQKALYYFEFSSQQNYSQSFIEMGLIYYLGTGVKIDLNKAFLYFVEAYKLNNPKAPLFIALIYLKKGMVLKALEYAKLSAEQNDVDAFILLGKIYSEMAVFKNIKKSIYYLEKACLEKSPQAQWLLGKIFLEVASVRNLNKGFNLLEQSSNQGLGIAQFYLGKLHFLGHYIEQNFSRATYYFNKAIEDLSIEIEKISTDYLDEYILACQACGYISAISAYLDKAKNYFVRVERFDHELTLNNLGVIYYFYDQDLDISKHYLMKSAEKNFILAEIILGIIYEKDNNLEESMKHFSKALELQDKNIYPDILMFSKCINLMKTYAKIKIIYLHLIKNISFESENLTRLSFKEISEQLFNRSDQENYIILTRSNSLYNDFYMLLTNNAKLINASQKITETIFYSPYTYLLGFFSTSSSNFINQDFIDGFLS